MLKRRLAVFLSALILAVSLYIGTKLDGEFIQAVTTYGTLPTVIIDAGHAALENTIIIPKKHRQANVEIIPKTRCISGF